MIAEVTPWFENAGMVGGILGASCGVIGGVIGCLGGLFAQRGIARGFTFGFLYTCLALAIGLLITAGIAYFGGQPYGVWYSFALPGGLMTFLIPCILPTFRQTYRKAEERRLAAEEFRGS